MSLLTVTELKEIAKNLNIPGYSTMLKQELIDAINVANGVTTMAETSTTENIDTNEIAPTGNETITP